MKIKINISGKSEWLEEYSHGWFKFTNDERRFITNTIPGFSFYESRNDDNECLYHWFSKDLRQNESFDMNGRSSNGNMIYETYLSKEEMEKAVKEYIANDLINSEIFEIRLVSDKSILDEYLTYEQAKEVIKKYKEDCEIYNTFSQKVED